MKDIIEQIKQLRLEEKTYNEIRLLTSISEDKLKRICRELELNKPINFITSKKLIKNDIIEYYKTVKSLRLTASFFGVSRETIRKIIPSELVIVKRERKISKSQSVIDWRKRKK